MNTGLCCSGCHNTRHQRFAETIFSKAVAYVLPVFTLARVCRGSTDRYDINTKKLLEIEKEIVREDARVLKN